MKLSSFISPTFAVEFFSAPIPGVFRDKETIEIRNERLETLKMTGSIDCCLIVPPDADKTLFVPSSAKTSKGNLVISVELDEPVPNYSKENADILVSIPIIYAARSTDDLSASAIRQIAQQSKKIVNLISSQAGDIFEGIDGELSDETLRNKINRDVMIKYPDLIGQIEDIQVKQRQLTVALCLGCAMEVMELIDRVPNSGSLLQALEQELGIIEIQEDEPPQNSLDSADDKLDEKNPPKTGGANLVDDDDIFAFTTGSGKS